MFSPLDILVAALRTAALNLLRLTGFDSIREGLNVVMHDITALFAMDAAAARETEVTL